MAHIVTVGLTAGRDGKPTGLVLVLTDGRDLRVPFTERLKGGTLAQLQNWRLIGGGEGVHWPDLDEDLSLKGALDGLVL